MTDATAIPTSWAYDCPLCGAPAGLWCITVNGHRVNTEHIARRRLADLTEHRMDTCTNCGETIVSHGGSPTGYAHIATSRARCDGISLDRYPRRALAGVRLALPA